MDILVYVHIATLLSILNTRRIYYCTFVEYEKPVIRLLSY